MKNNNYLKEERVMNTNLAFNLLRTILIGTLAIGNTCSRHSTTSTDQPASMAVNNSSNITPSPQIMIDLTDIKKVDFDNFIYPVPDALNSYFPAKTFQVINGKYEYKDESRKLVLWSSGTIYDQVTGKDAITDAVVVFEHRSAGPDHSIGTGREYCVYIYGLIHRRLKLLWSFVSGDRSAGGLRDIYGEGGNLVIETYNSDVSYDSKGEATEGAACCAKTYTRAIYQWTGFRYQLIEARRYDNPLENVPLMIGNHRRNE